MSIPKPKLPTSNRALLGSFIIFFCLAFMVNWVFVPEFKYLTQTFNYSPQQAYAMLGTYGVSGRSQHLVILGVDMLMTAGYLIFLSGTIRRTFATLFSEHNPLQIVSWVPVVLAVFQGVEIILVLALLLLYPARVDLLAAIASKVTVVKFGLTIVSFLLSLAGLAGLGLKRLVRPAAAPVLGRRSWHQK